MEVVEVNVTLLEVILDVWTASEVVIAGTQEATVNPGARVDEAAVEKVEALGMNEVKVRTPLSCETRYGLVAKCYGRELGRGSLLCTGYFPSAYRPGRSLIRSRRFRPWALLLYTSDAADDLSPLILRTLFYWTLVSTNTDNHAF